MGEVVEASVERGRRKVSGTFFWTLLAKFVSVDSIGVIVAGGLLLQTRPLPTEVVAREFAEPREMRT